MDAPNLDVQQHLNRFQREEDWAEADRQYEILRREILGDDEDTGADGGDQNDDYGEGEDDSAPMMGGDSAEAIAAEQHIEDFTEQDLTAMRKQMYLTIMSSATADEITHKLLKMSQSGGRQMENAAKRHMCNMLIETCSNERTFVKDYGLVGERLCRISREFQDLFDESFALYYATIHRYDSTRLRNIARFFAWLLHSDAMDWSTLVYIRLTEEDTTSASRIFVKTLLRVSVFCSVRVFFNMMIAHAVSLFSGGYRLCRRSVKPSASMNSSDDSKTLRSLHISLASSRWLHLHPHNTLMYLPSSQAILPCTANVSSFASISSLQSASVSALSACESNGSAFSKSSSSISS